MLKNSLLRGNRGLAQIPILLGLLLMVVAVPAATRLVQQNQDARNKASGNSAFNGTIWDGTRRWVPGADCANKKGGSITVTSGNITWPDDSLGGHFDVQGGAAGQLQTVTLNPPAGCGYTCDSWEVIDRADDLQSATVVSSGRGCVATLIPQSTDWRSGIQFYIRSTAVTASPTPATCGLPVNCFYTESNQANINRYCTVGVGMSPPPSGKVWAPLSCNSGPKADGTCGAWTPFRDPAQAACKDPFCTGCAYVNAPVSPTPIMCASTDECGDPSCGNPGDGLECAKYSYKCGGGLKCMGSWIQPGLPGFFCRNSSCPLSLSCVCPTSTPFPTLPYPPSPRPTVTISPTSTPVTSGSAKFNGAIWDGTGRWVAGAVDCNNRKGVSLTVTSGNITWPTDSQGGHFDVQGNPRGQQQTVTVTLPSGCGWTCGTWNLYDRGDDLQASTIVQTGSGCQATFVPQNTDWRTGIHFNIVRVPSPTPTVVPPLACPTNLNLSCVGGRVSASWNAIALPASGGYRFYRRPGGSTANHTALWNGRELSYVDNGSVCNNNYSYLVSAYSAPGVTGAWPWPGEQYCTPQLVTCPCASPTPTAIPHGTCTVNVTPPTIPGGRYSFSASFAGGAAGRQVELALTKRNGSTYGARIIPAPTGLSERLQPMPVVPYYNYLIGGAATTDASGNASISGSVTGLAAGTYFIHCGGFHGGVEGEVCSGNPDCTYEGGTMECRNTATGYTYVRSCGNQATDHAFFTVSLPPPISPSPTRTPSITPSPATTPYPCSGVQHCVKGGTVKFEYCGDCTGGGCRPGPCTAEDGTCVTFRDKYFYFDEVYPVPCNKFLPALSCNNITVRQGSVDLTSASATAIHNVAPGSTINVAVSASTLGTLYRATTSSFGTIPDVATDWVIMSGGAPVAGPQSGTFTAPTTPGTYYYTFAANAFSDTSCTNLCTRLGNYRINPGGRTCLSARGSGANDWTVVGVGSSCTSNGCLKYSVIRVVATATPTSIPLPATCNVSINKSTFNRGENVVISASGNGNNSGDYDVRLWLEKRDFTRIVPDPNGGMLRQTGFQPFPNDYYTEYRECRSSNGTACTTTSATINNLELGDYYIHCDVIDRANPMRGKCSGNKACSYEGGTRDCSTVRPIEGTPWGGWVSCSSNDNAAFSVTLPALSCNNITVRQGTVNLLSSSATVIHDVAPGATIDVGVSAMPYGTMYRAITSSYGAIPDAVSDWAMISTAVPQANPQRGTFQAPTTPGIYYYTYAANAFSDTGCTNLCTRLVNYRVNPGSRTCDSARGTGANDWPIVTGGPCTSNNCLKYSVIRVVATPTPTLIPCSGNCNGIGPVYDSKCAAGLKCLDTNNPPQTVPNLKCRNEQCRFSTNCSVCPSPSPTATPTPRFDVLIFDDNPYPLRRVDSIVCSGFETIGNGSIKVDGTVTGFRCAEGLQNGRPGGFPVGTNIPHVRGNSGSHTFGINLPAGYEVIAWKAYSESCAAGSSWISCKQTPEFRGTGINTSQITFNKDYVVEFIVRRSVVATITPSPTATRSPSITPTRVLSVTPSPTITRVPSPTVSRTPSVTPTSTWIPSVTPSPTATNTPTASRTPTPTRAFCNGSCVTTSDCISGLTCISRVCKNSSCPTDSDCVCGTSPTPTITQTPSPTNTVVPTRTPTATRMPSITPSVTRNPTPTGTTPEVTRTATPTTTTAPSCKVCPTEFKCYKKTWTGSEDEYKWFVDGYVMIDFVNVANSQCSSRNIPTPGYKGKTLGDANCDGFIQGADYSVWRKEFVDFDEGRETVGSWESDFNCDRIINGLDYSRWKANYILPR